MFTFYLKQQNNIALKRLVIINYIIFTFRKLTLNIIKVKPFK